MYKKRLKDWGYRKYIARQVHENCAEKLEECNGEDDILSDEELEGHPVPAKQVRRSLKRKNTDGEHFGNIHRPQRLSMGFFCFQDWTDKLIGARKSGKPMAGSGQTESTNKNHDSSFSRGLTGSEGDFSFLGQPGFQADFGNVLSMPQNEVLTPSNSDPCLAVGSCLGDGSEDMIIGNGFSNLELLGLLELPWMSDPFPFSFVYSPSQTSSHQSTTEIPSNSEGYQDQYTHFTEDMDHSLMYGTQNITTEDLDVPAIHEGNFIMSDLSRLAQSHRKIANDEVWILICFLSAGFQASGQTRKAMMGLKKLPGLFRSMVAEQNIYMLSAIVIVAVIMEAYGYDYLASQVLQHACVVCDASFGSADDITLMVKFIVNMLDKEGRQYRLKPCDIEDVMCNMLNKFGEGHPHFLVTLYNLARAYDLAGHPIKAATHLSRLDDLCQLHLSPGNGLSIICRMSLARINAQEGHTTAAVNLVKSAILQCKQSWGENHPYTLECVRRLAILSQSTGAPQAIEALLHKVLQGRREKLGPTHRYTKGSEMQLAQWKSKHAGVNWWH
jgi:hypothetical protein